MLLDKRAHRDAQSERIARQRAAFAADAQIERRADAGALAQRDGAQIPEAADRKIVAVGVEQRAQNEGAVAHRATAGVVADIGHDDRPFAAGPYRSEEHKSELQSIMRISYAVSCLKKNKLTKSRHQTTIHTKQ